MHSEISDLKAWALISDLLSELSKSPNSGLGFEVRWACSKQSMWVAMDTPIM